MLTEESLRKLNHAKKTLLVLGGSLGARRINEFIEKYQPTQLFIEATNKPGKEGQKDKIWLQYIKVNLKADGYVIGNQGDGFSIQNNKKIN